MDGEIYIKTEYGDKIQLKTEDPMPSTSASPYQHRGAGTGRKKRVPPPPRDPPTIDNFWDRAVEDVKSMNNVDSKNQILPLARIKKIMKLDENAKMIAAEAPLLFAKACEYFIQELTLRAWVHTEENKRRTLQRSDIATAISIYDQFDFLIDIVPRDEIKPATTPTTSSVPTHTVKKEAVDTGIQNPAPAATVTTNNEQQPLQYFVQVNQPNVIQGGLIAAGQGLQGVNIVTPQNIQTPVLGSFPTTSTANQGQPQAIQFVQQVMTSNGEIQNVPITITPQQLNLLKLQQQPIVIPTASQAQPLFQLSTAATSVQSSVTSAANATTSTNPTTVFINAIPTSQQSQSQQQTTNAKC
ncbi:NFYC family protein [Megaselia abdita]